MSSLELDEVALWLAKQGLSSTAHRWVVALSGGRDSTVLLHFMNALARRQGIALVAWHVNHQLQPKALEWAEQCQYYCDELKVPLSVLTVQVPDDNGLGIEANARAARYGAFKGQTKAGDVLLLGHHQQDNAETFLHHATRGSGPKGLSSMAPLQVLKEGTWIARPFLDINPQAMQSYAEAHDLEWIEDPSNQDLHFRRNYLRHKVIPLLEEAYPAAVSCLSRSARLCAEAMSILEEVARADIQACQVEGANSGWLNKSKFLALSEGRQKQVIRYLIADLKASMPRHDHLEAWIAQIKNASLNENPLLEGANWKAQAYPNVICVLGS